MTDKVSTTEIETLADAYKRFPAAMSHLSEEGFSVREQLEVAQKIALDLADGASA